MSDSPDPQDLLRRLEQLERENARLRAKLEPLFGPDNPNFKPDVFLRVLNRIVMLSTLPVLLGIGLMFAANYVTPGLKNARVGDVPLFSFAGQGGKVRGIGMGLISFGGLSVGAVSLGGFSVGLVAVGGCSVGVVAIGGGACGVIALGGGAIGVVAVGGGATGYYAMGQKAHGRYALGINRQDEEAVAFFRRYVPGLNAALTNPMPVILLDRPKPDGARTGAHESPKRS